MGCSTAAAAGPNHACWLLAWLLRGPPESSPGCHQLQPPTLLASGPTRASCCPTTCCSIQRVHAWLGGGPPGWSAPARIAHCLLLPLLLLLSEAALRALPRRRAPSAGPVITIMVVAGNVASKCFTASAWA